MYEVKTDQFSGPLEKLLELIEEKKLEVTTISLGEVTADFMQYLQTLAEQAKHPSVLADFVVVASRLLLIKSKSLLPSLELTQEEERDIHDLEARLKIYQEFKTASATIQNIWQQGQSMHSRTFLMGAPVVFYPPADLTVSSIESALHTILKELQAIVPDTHTVKKAVVTIEEKVKEIMQRLNAKSSHSFHTISKDKPKIEVIILFLAVLHLLRDRLITTQQEDKFSDIIISNQHESERT